MKLRAVITAEWEVDDLEHYQATTLQEAAERQQKAYEEGEIGALDFLSWGEFVKVKIEPVEEEDGSKD